MNKVAATVIADGACSGNPGPGGWSARIDFPGGRIYRVSGGEIGPTTNNRMEMMAIIKGLEKARSLTSGSIEVQTDSCYIVNSMIFGWKRVKNVDLWDQLDGLSNNVTWKYIPRNSTEVHEECDKLAKWETQKARYTTEEGSSVN